eukprot:gene14662-biopygen2097
MQRCWVQCDPTGPCNSGQEHEYRVSVVCRWQCDVGGRSVVCWCCTGETAPVPRPPKPKTNAHSPRHARAMPAPRPRQCPVPPGPGFNVGSGFFCTKGCTFQRGQGRTGQDRTGHTWNTAYREHLSNEHGIVGDSPLCPPSNGVVSIPPNLQRHAFAARLCSSGGAARLRRAARCRQSGVPHRPSA